MIKRLLWIFFLLVLTFSSHASHIVGGEFELLHISGSTYRLNLILYFDNAGNPGAFDDNILARVFRKSDNSAMLDINIPFISRNTVEYLQPECAVGGVSNDRILYSTTISLPKNNFNDQEGYYVAWERCCRNYTINNIISNHPDDGQYAGQTFYLHFPAVVDKNSDPFINSSPQLFPPLNDYGCPFRPYWVDFSGTDIDGDSLVYTLVSPLSTFDPVPVPVNGPGAGPYIPVIWRSGFGIDNIMGGSPKLNVDSVGFLTVTPTQSGLFVFAVKCEEYRDGVKIGELIRDFQMKVLDTCPVAEPPIIKGKKLADATYTDTGFLNVIFENTESDATRCIRVQVSDPDASNIQNSKSEDISLQVIALNFDPTDRNLSSILPDVFSTTLTDGSIEEFEICFPECPFVDPIENSLLKIGIIAFDDACALPLSDTLIVQVEVIPPVNNSPVIFSSGNDVPALTRTEVQGAGKSISIPIEGTDSDGHNVMMQISTVEEFDLAKAGMSFSYSPKEEFETAPINTTFTWNLDCHDADLDFSEGITISPDGAEVVKKYQLEILLEDEDDCSFSREDKLEMDLNIKFPEEFEPNVYQVGQSELLRSLRHEYYLNQVIDIDIRAKDGGTDTDNINLRAVGSNFNLADYGVTFENKTNQAGEVTTPFKWSLDCDKFNLAEIDSFRVFFITEDINACNLANKDTLSIDFLIDVFINRKPKLEFVSTQVVDNTIFTNIRDEVSVIINGYEIGLIPDRDTLYLSLLTVDGSRDISNFEFSPAKNFQSVSSKLSWTPDCQHLSRLDTGKYRFTFLLQDNHCPNPMSDTLSLDITVNDIFNDIKIFDPPNVFTPNKDEKMLNEFFGMYNMINGELVNILPVDNCKGVFENVEIFNRWGKEVFSSTDREFKWYGKEEPAGVYFYLIKYSHTTYKGTVSIFF